MLFNPMEDDSFMTNPSRDKILEKAKKTAIAQFKIKDDIIYQEEMVTFKKAYVILDMFKDFAIGCCLPEDVDIDPIVIPLPHLPAQAMEVIIRWCRHHRDEPDMTREQLTDSLYHCNGEVKDPWDFALYEGLEEETLFEVLLATKYLGIPEMRDTLSTYVAKCMVLAEEEEKRKVEQKDQRENANRGATLEREAVEEAED